MAQVDCILVSVLDLIHHPENANTYGVALAAHVEYTDMKWAKNHLQALLSGKEPPGLPEMIPKLFQISKTARIDPDVIPASMERGAVTQIQKLRDEGSLRPEDLMVRALWVEGEVTLESQATFYFCRVIPPELIQKVAEWKGETGGPITTKDLIFEFNRLKHADVARRRKLSTMVPSQQD